MKKSEHHDIDAVFRQHFEAAAVPLENADALWGRIANEQKKNRYGLWIWFLGTALALLLVTLAYMPYHKGITSGHKAIIVDSAQTNSFSQLSESSVSSSINQSTNEKASVSSSSIVSAASNTNPENNKAIPIPLESGVESDSDSDSEHLKNEVTQITKTPQSSSDSELQDFTTTSPINFAESTSATTSEELTPTTRLAQLSTLSSINDQVFSRDLPFLDFRDKDSWSKCEVKIPGHFFVDLYGMGALPMDKIELQPGSDQFVYRDLWDDRFDPVSSWHGGIQAGYQFPWGLSISAGLEYQHLITKYEDDQSITEMITIWDPMAYFYRDSNNDIVWVGDSVTAINIYERKVVSENKTTLYHLPVQVSIELYKKPNFHIAADVAAILNFSKSYTGQFIRSDQTLIAIDSGNHDNYLKTDIGISYEAGIRMGYFFNDNWEAYLSPRFRYNPNSYLLDSEVLKVTRNFVGLRTGVRYHF